MTGIKIQKQKFLNQVIKMKSTKKDTKEWFKEWANEYDDTLGKIKRHHHLLNLVVKLSNVKKNQKVLDVGCGTGLLSLKFLEKADCFITGIDSSLEMLSLFIEKINKLSLSDRIVYKLEDAGSLNFKKNSFDIVASTVTLHHLKNKYSTIKKIHNILKPGGRFVLGDIDMDTTGRITDPKRLLRMLEWLKEEFALALNEGGVEAFSRMYDNGKKHILNDGEYCIGFKQWKELCKRTEFRKVTVKSLPDFKWFKVLVAIK
ncbi:demethylrebeccamycin-D-glucose O-methyltransferase [bacterium BMS3Abin06]|nr:demethylrebeccamycin-D-glucose O-methyltransferase [bacterium BMS3Abin06]